MATKHDQILVLLTEYEQVKREIRIGLDVYEKVYAPIITLFIALVGVFATTNLNETAKSTLFVITPFVILGLFGTLFYGHPIALRRLSARLEVIEDELNSLINKKLLTGQIRFSTTGRRGWAGLFQNGLFVLSLLPGILFYWWAASQADRWWIDFFENIGLASIKKGYPTAGFLILLLLFLVACFAYLRKLENELKQLKNEIFNNHPRKK